MPNWCDTTYKCVGETKQLEELYNTLQKLEFMKDPYVKNGFGRLWLGCVIEALGGQWEDVRCRGEVTDYNLEDDVLTIYQSTAWCEQEEFRHFLEKHYPGMKIYYQEEEPGCDVYYTNDTTGDFFPSQYLLDGYEKQEYFDSLESLIDYVKGLTGKDSITTEEDVYQALDAYEEEQQEENEDAFYCLHKFQLCDD